jgi:hypothetical protein
MLNAGALGYISKTARIDELLLGVRTVMLGQRYLSPEVAAMMANTPPDKASQARLGRREIAVLTLIAQGQTSPEIAKTLHIATGTVEVHRSNIMEKLDLRPGVRSRPDVQAHRRRAIVGAGGTGSLNASLDRGEPKPGNDDQPGLCSFTYSRNASSMRVCQPGPLALKNSVTSADRRIAVAVLRGFFCGPR